MKNLIQRVVIILLTFSSVITSPLKSFSPTSLDFELCRRPTCSILEIGTLWPTKISPMLYYRCMQNIFEEWTPRILFCTDNTFFSFSNQKCVAYEEWRDVCPVNGTTLPTVTSSSSTSVIFPTSTSISTEVTTIDFTEDITTEAPDTTQDQTNSESSSTAFSSVPPSIETSELPRESTTSTETLSSLSSAPAPTTPSPGFELCEDPICTNDTGFTLWPNRDSKIYFRCVPVGRDNWIWRLYWCPKGRLFSFSQQNCVDPQDWKEPSDASLCLSEI